MMSSISARKVARMVTRSINRFQNNPRFFHKTVLSLTGTPSSSLGKASKSSIAELWNQVKVLLSEGGKAGWQHFPRPRQSGDEKPEDDGPKDEKKQENDNDREKKNDENRQNDEKPHNDGPKKSPYDMWAERQRGTTESTEGGPSNQMKWVMGIAGVAAFIGVLYYISREPAAEITFQAFISELLARDLVDKIEVVNKQKVRVYLKGRDPAESNAQYYFNIGHLESFDKKFEEVLHTLNIPVESRPVVTYKSETNYLKVFLNATPTLLFVGLLGYFLWSAVTRMRSKGGAGGGMGNIFSIGKSNAKLWSKNDKINVAFKDVAGCDEAKVEIMEFVSFLKNPGKYEELGAKIPKGALLVGPPGTGKTLLAKATAGEAGVPFYSVSGSDFIEMFVGVGPSRVRDLFQQARQNAPCIIFIDEIDAIGRARGGRGNMGGNDERENTLNQLLVEMDGFSSSKGIVVLAGTNRADILDKALLRPGRFDRNIAIDLPDIKARADIFKVHLKPLALEHSIEFYANRLAAMTPGFSGADIANVCNEAALIAARRDKTAITYDHFEAAIERVVGGLEKKTRLLSPEEKKIVAFHEAGHAVVSWFLEHAHPLLKVSIIPRGSGALGYAMYMPEERKLYTREQLLDMICSALGGRAAEEIVFNSITTGASDDLQKVTNIAYSQYLRLGMSETMGPATFGSLQDDGFLGKPFSDHTSEAIDKEVRKLISDAYVRTKDIIHENRDAFDKLANVLLEKEVLSFDDVKTVLGPRQWEFNPLHEEYMKMRHPEPPAAATAQQ